MFAKSFCSRAGTAGRCTATARRAMPLRAKVISPVFMRKAQVHYFPQIETSYTKGVIDGYNFRFAAGSYQGITR